MFRILCIFAIGIVGFGHPMTRAKLAPPFPIYIGQDAERVSYMRKKTLEEVKADFESAWGDRFDYSLINAQNYVNTLTEVQIICPVHGVINITPHDHIWSKWGCPLCGKEHQGKGAHTKQRHLVYGVGINDSKISTGSSKEREPSYALWKSILSRCYGKEYLKRATYKNCSVCNEWLFYSNFKKWFDDPINGYRKGYHIDKDILVRGNKIYSPDTCCFVPPEINTLIVKHDATRGDLPIGVTKNNSVSRGFRAIVRIYGKYHTIGYFDTIEEAFNAYKLTKETHIQEMATRYYKDGKITKKVYNALMNYKVEITD